MKNKTVKKINIGAILDLTNEASQDAAGIMEGINLAIRDLNKDGYKLQVNYIDDKSNVGMLGEAINELVGEHHIQALIGPTWSYQIGSVVPVIEQEQLPVFAPAVASDCLIFGSKFLLFGAERNAYKEKSIIDFINEHKIKNVALIISQDGWGVSHIAPVKKATQRTSTNLVYVEQLLPYISSFGDQMIKDAIDNCIKNKADLIIWAGYEFEANSLAKTLAKSNSKISIIGDQLLVFGERFNLLKKYKGNIFIFNNKFSEPFEKIFKDAYHKNPTLYSDVAYDGTRILVENIAKGLKGKELIECLKRERFSYKGFAGNYKFDQNGDINLGNRWEIKKVY